MKHAKSLSIFITSSLVLLASCVFYPKGVTENYIKQAQTTVTISVPAGYGAADEARVTSYLINENETPLRKTERTVSITNASFQYDFAYFGKHELTCDYYSNGKKLGTELAEYVITATEYNSAILSGETTRNTYSSLMTGNFSITAGGDSVTADGDSENNENLVDSTLPTFAALLDSNDSLPPAVYACPFVNDSTKGWTSIINGFSEYIRYLHNLNPESKFNLAVNDFDAAIYPWVILANGITAESSTLLMISDGDGTYSHFRATFGASNSNDNSESIFNNYTQRWNTVKRYAASGGTFMTEMRKVANESGGDSDTPARYLDHIYAVVALDEGITAKWIVYNKNADANHFGDTTIAKRIADSERVCVYSVNKN